MTDGDEGTPEAGTAGDPAALTRQTAPSPRPGAGPWRGRSPEERAAALETADTVDVPEPWRRPRPVASTRSWPAPVTSTGTRRLTVLEGHPRRPRARCRTADHRLAVHRRPARTLLVPCARLRPLSARPPADPTPTTPSMRPRPRPRPMNVTVHAGAGATPGSSPRRRERGGSAADSAELDRPGRRASEEPRRGTASTAACAPGSGTGAPRPHLRRRTAHPGRSQSSPPSQSTIHARVTTTRARRRRSSTIPPGPGGGSALAPIFAQRYSPQVAGSRRMCQAYS